MNKVFYKGGHIPLTPAQLAKEANAIYSRPVFCPEDFEGTDSRIAGIGHCDCNNDAEFELLPINDISVIEGQKRYMVCRKCGGISHL